MRSFVVIAWRKSSSSSERLISQGERLAAAQGERFPCRFGPEPGHKENPTREDLLFILELEPSLSVGESLEDEAEFLSDLGEGGHEDTLLLRLDALDEADDRVPLFLQF